MVGERLGECIGMKEELIKKACYLSMRTHNGKKKYLYQSSRSSPDAVFAFAGSWSVDDWFSQKPFGAKKINLDLFPSLKSIGNDETALVNEAFIRRLETLLQDSPITNQVDKAVSERKQIVFAGHSSGGPVAILTTIWFLEKYTRLEGSESTPFCVTFGSPLVGDRIFSHALTRENWARYFMHFVTRYDIVPRIMLAPLSSIEKELNPILQFFSLLLSFRKEPKPILRIPKLKLTVSPIESIEKPNEASALFMNVMKKASAVASHAMCNLTECTNILLQTVSNVTELSPYRPFGTYIFCTGNGKLVVLKNPDAILQLLFYSSQLSCETEGEEVASRSLNQHMEYENELQESLNKQNIIYLNHLEDLPLYLDGSASSEVESMNTALNDLGLSSKARLCLRAAGKAETQKKKKQEKMDSNMDDIRKKLKEVLEYRKKCEVRKVGYYDAFKLQEEEKDFKANLKRLDLASIWDEIIELLKRYELPDEFEGREEWIKLGTEYRRLVEPLDIANYYRHSKDAETDGYLNPKGRPKRYRYTQRWREHAARMVVGSSVESCFWAEVEELRNTERSFEDMKEKILGVEKRVLQWVGNEELRKDVFLDKSTFAKWWKTLPDQHRSESYLAQYMTN